MTVHIHFLCLHLPFLSLLLFPPPHSLVLLQFFPSLFSFFPFPLSLCFVCCFCALVFPAERSIHFRPLLGQFPLSCCCTWICVAVLKAGWSFLRGLPAHALSSVMIRSHEHHSYHVQHRSASAIAMAIPPFFRFARQCFHISFHSCFNCDHTSVARCSCPHARDRGVLASVTKIVSLPLL